ncbi:hypothetical protein KCU87_g398, partial [Aureobasidium melanogenum]
MLQCRACSDMPPRPLMQASGLSMTLTLICRSRGVSEDQRLNTRTLIEAAGQEGFSAETTAGDVRSILAWQSGTQQTGSPYRTDMFTWRTAASRRGAGFEPEIG